jgi:hypothetical protein
MSSEDKKKIPKLIKQGDRTSQIIKRTIQEKEIGLETGQNQIRNSIDKKPFYGYVPEKKEMSLALDITTSDGNNIGLEYHKISSWFNFNKSGTISFQADGHEIKIEGRNLRPVYEYLLEHRLVWIAGAISEFEKFPDDETVIDIITITPLSELD